MCSTMGTSARTTLKAMGRVDLDDLGDDECEKILEVIQRDYDIRAREKERILREKEELEDEQFKAEILARTGDFNSVCCIRCCNKFGLILNRKRTCAGCKFNMCKSCTIPDAKTGEDLCKTCFQQRQIALKSCDFFYSGVKQKFTNFGSAKFVKTLKKRRESDVGMANYETASVCDSEDGSTLRRRPSLLNLLEQTKQLCEEPTGSRFDTASMGRRCTWAGGQLPSHNLQAPIQQFETSLTSIIEDVHKLIQDYDLMNDTEVLDPEHFLFRKPRRELYNELLKLSQHISDSMVSDSDDDDDIMQRTNHQSAIRVRRYVVQKVEHITKTNLKHLLPEQDEGVEDWDTETGKKFLEEQLCFVILKKVLENYMGRSSPANSLHTPIRSKSMQTLVITEEYNFHADPAESYCSTLMPRSPSLHSERRNSNSSSDCAKSQSDMTLPSFSSGSNRDVNLKIASLMKGNSPMPSLETQKSPIGRLEMDLDDLSSLQKFVYYSDEEPESEDKKDAEEDDFFEEKKNDTFMLKEHGTDELVAWSPAEEKLHYIKPPNVAMPHHLDRISPMVGDIIVEELSDLSEPASESESDVAASDAEEEKNKSGKRDDESIKSDSENENIPTNVSETRESIKSENKLDGDNVDDKDGDDQKNENSDLVKTDVTIEVTKADTTEPKKRKSTRNKQMFKVGSDGEDDEKATQTKSKKSDLSESDNLAVPTIESKKRKSLKNESKSKSSRVDEDGADDRKTAKEKKVKSREAKAEETGYSKSVKNKTGVTTDSNDSSGKSKAEESPGSKTSVATKPSKKSSAKHSKQEPSSVSESEASTEVQSQPENTPLEDTPQVVPTVTVEAPGDNSQNDTAQDPQEDSNTESTNEENDPKITSISKQTSVKRGDTLTLSCELVGTEPLDVFWYYEKDFETCLENDEKYEITKKQNTFSLTIYYCDKADAGEYVVIGVNELGQCSRKFKVKIVDNPIQFKPPEFLKKISDVELDEGKNHKFTVRVSGQPPPRVVWYKDTDILQPGDMYQIERIGNRNFSLSLYSVTLEDDAEYSAVAINVAGRTDCSAQLFVESKR